MPKYLVVFVSEGQVTDWLDTQYLNDAQNYREELPYWEPWIGAGYILTECSEHGWRPASSLTGACGDCHDLYCEFEFRQEADYSDEAPGERAFEAMAEDAFLARMERMW